MFFLVNIPQFCANIFNNILRYAHSTLLKFLVRNWISALKIVLLKHICWGEFSVKGPPHKWANLEAASNVFKPSNLVSFSFIQICLLLPEWLQFANTFWSIEKLLHYKCTLHLAVLNSKNTSQCASFLATKCFSATGSKLTGSFSFGTSTTWRFHS